MPDFHAQILYGDAADKLAAEATALAVRALCTGDKPPCHRCAHCRKVVGGIHPDVITLEADLGKGLPISAIRALQGDVLLRPNEGERKIYIFPQADLMDARAQNALLKLLEEAPAYAMFFLLARNPKALLETVRSRCRLVSVGGEPPAQNEAATTQARRLLTLLEGGDALALLEGSMALEKTKREELIPLLEALLALLAERAKSQGEPYLSWYDEVYRMRQSLDFNLGAAHLSGWFATL